MPGNTRAFYKPWAGPGRALCPTRSLLQSHVGCAPVVIQHSGHPCFCWAFCDVAFPRLWEHSAKQAEGQCSSGSHAQVRSKIFLTGLLDPVFLTSFSFGLWFSGIPLCEWEHNVLPLLLGYKIYQSMAMFHSSVEHRKEGYQIVLKLQGKVRKAGWTLLSLECTWDICCQALNPHAITVFFFSTKRLNNHPGDKRRAPGNLSEMCRAQKEPQFPITPLARK